MLPINQHNYEEFFLLYVDGELSATDKQAVDRFVQEHPHLAVELDMLQQAQLPAEKWSFDDKNLLYRNGSAEINTTNHEEQFLLYVDNELNASGKEQVERFVLQHPALQESFTRLKQTRLVPEQILFPDKADLYREEKKERRVIYMRWQRIAVAAVLTGVAVLLWTVIPQQPNTEPVLAQQTNTPAANGNGAATITTPVTGTTTLTGGDKVAAVTAGNTNPINAAVSTQQNAVVNTPATDLLAVNTEPVKTNEAVRNDADVITTVSGNGFETVASNTNRVSGNNAVLDNVDMVKPANEQLNNITDNTDNNIHPAVYRELDTESADQKKTLLLGSLEINKDKLRGFFRKAGSIFRSKAKTEEENSSSSISTRPLK